jgi:hypothetical protein
MKLKLHYPIKDLSEVEVGIITIRAFGIASTARYMVDGTSLARVLAEICGQQDFRPFLNLAELDALRIVRAAKRTNVNSPVYDRRYECECGYNMCVAPFDLTLEPNKLDLYDQEHVYEDGTGNHIVKIAPMTVGVGSEILSAAGDMERQLEITAKRIGSYDGKANGQEKAPFDLLVYWLPVVLADEIAEIKKIVSGVGFCPKCKKEKEQTIGLYDYEFLFSKK